MKNSIARIAAGLFFVLVFFACKKDQPVAILTPANNDTTITTLGTMQINLSYPYETVKGNFELVISEPNGKVLLDTLAAVETPVVAALNTNARLVDLTYVIDNGTQSGSAYRYNVCIYKGVNPATWVNVNSEITTIRYPFPGTTTQARIYCLNYPASAIAGGNAFQSFGFSNGVNNYNTEAIYDAIAHTVSIAYNRRAGVYNYFVIPHLGLYKFYASTKDYDTLDASRLDTVNTVSFTRNFPFTIDYEQCDFQGIPDSTDLTKSVGLLDIFSPGAPVHGDLQYPKTSMQKYEIRIGGQNSSHDNLQYYGYVNSIPVNLNLPDVSSFNVVSQQGDNFAIQFRNPSSTSYCNTQFAGTAAAVSYWSSSDSTLLHPITFLTNQKSKLLNGVTLNDLIPTSFIFGNAPGFSYADYLSFTCSSLTQRPTVINNYTTFYRAF